MLILYKMAAKLLVIQGRRRKKQKLENLLQQEKMAQGKASISEVIYISKIFLVL